MRTLLPGLLVEGSDGPYLRSLVERQLEATLLEHSAGTVDVLRCEVSDVRSNDKPDRVLAAAEELARDCDIVFVHGDLDAVDARLKLIAELDARRALAPRAGVSVPLVPVLETESWMLADRKALESVVGPLADYPYGKPSAVEGRVALKGAKPKLDAKQVWKKLTGPGGAEVLRDSAELLVRRTDLAVLAQVPSYQAWCDDTERALRGAQFL
ncbi:hypothetical protein ACIRQY_26585 [Streptomyces sp. NPDC101490]|uniref:hypothetical protein n=1 Tax=Streptomyces sp. NPDC101490 TaxID=3366143 RepID=UPI00381ACB54